jgi:hypothetical protein
LHEAADTARNKDQQAQTNRGVNRKGHARLRKSTRTDGISFFI